MHCEKAEGCQKLVLVVHIMSDIEREQDWHCNNTGEDVVFPFDIGWMSQGVPLVDKCIA